MKKLCLSPFLVNKKKRPALREVAAAGLGFIYRVPQDP